MVDAMLFEQRLWAGLADGSVRVTFRRWKRPRARAGGRHRTPAGCWPSTPWPRSTRPSSARTTRAAGFASLADLLRQLDRHGDGPVYRVDFHHAGADPREALRQDAALPEEELARLRARLDRLDLAARDGPWTVAALRLIADRPGMRAADLAAAVGRERLAFKTDVRKLKELGLTESLEVGYRLSPRGRALLERLG